MTKLLRCSLPVLENMMMRTTFSPLLWYVAVPPVCLVACLIFRQKTQKDPKPSKSTPVASKTMVATRTPVASKTPVAKVCLCLEIGVPIINHNSGVTITGGLCP
jgi:hypothetical protein